MKNRLYGNKIIDPVVRLGETDIIRRNALINGLYYDAEDISETIRDNIDTLDPILGDVEYINMTNRILNNIKEENGVMDSIYTISDEYMHNELYMNLVHIHLKNIHKFESPYIARIKSTYMELLLENGFSKNTIDFIIDIDSKLPDTLPCDYWEYVKVMNSIIVSCE